MRVASIHANVNPAFSGIIYFSTAKRSDVQTNYKIHQNTEIVKEPAPADVVELFDEAGKAVSALWPVLDRFEDVFAYAKKTISEMSDAYLEACISNNRDISRGTLRIKDDKIGRAHV